MAHELDFNLDGTARFVSVRENAWHGLGQIIPDYVSSDEMLRIGGLDYEVTKELVYAAGQDTPIPNVRATVRSDDKKVLGIVSPAYHVISTRETVEVAKSITGDEEANFETMGVLHGGKKIFILMKLNKELYVAGEAINPFFLIENSYDGKQSLRATATPIRVVCQNTLNMAMSGSKRIVSLRHSANYEQRLTEAQKTLGLVKLYYQTFEEQATALVNKLFSRAMFDDLTHSLIPDAAPEASRTVKENVDKQRDTLVQCYNADDLNNVRGTAWAAYNAVADFSDHWQTVRGEGRVKAERQFEKALHDTDMKDEALQRILALV